MANIDVSIIIPTYNRFDLLRKVLSSLAKQRFAPDRYEVVVVDDGSTDETFTVTELSFAFALRYVRQENQGGVSARNRGAQESRGKVLIFIDDDMTFEPDYVTGLVTEHRSFERIVGMGTCYLCPPDGESPFPKIASASNTLSVDGDGESRFVSFTECATNNLSIKREAFFEVGMTEDVVGGGPGLWGDVDFAYRARQAGFRFRRSGKAICYHHDYWSRDLESACERIEQVSGLVVLLFKKNPGLEPHLPMFRDKSPVSLGHDPPVLVLRKLARSVISSRPILQNMQRLTGFIEATAPSPALLRPLYRWIIGGHIYRGYREGLRAYGPVMEVR